jgi:hypothetical protein
MNVFMSRMIIVFAGCAALAGCKGKIEKGTAADDGPMAAYEKLVEACRAEDAEALWALFDEHLRGQIDRLAGDMQQLGEEHLAEIYGYDGKVDDFDGKSYLAGMMKVEDEFTNLCFHADDWVVNDRGRLGDLYVVSVTRPDKLVQGIKLRNKGDRWVVFDITRPLEPPSPPR